jgi:hypothetical protein
MIELFHPVKSCPVCHKTTDDEEHITCSPCRTAYETNHEWGVYHFQQVAVESLAFSEGWIFLDEPVFVDAKLTFPRQLLYVHGDQTVSHAGEVEEDFTLEVFAFWQKYDFSKVNRVLAKGVQWRVFDNSKQATERKEKVERKDSKDCKECHICGALQPQGAETHLSLFHMKEIVPGIFLGAQWNAFSLSELRHFKIRSLLNCAIEIGSTLHTERFGENYRKLEWDDVDTQDILSEMDSVYRWIELQRQQKPNLLIHCAMGRSRSVSVLIYYLMKSQGISYDEALRVVRLRQPHAQPNCHFEKQLRTVEHKTNHSS